MTPNEIKIPERLTEQHVSVIIAYLYVLQSDQLIGTKNTDLILDEICMTRDYLSNPNYWVSSLFFDLFLEGYSKYDAPTNLTESVLKRSVSKYLQGYRGYFIKFFGSHRDVFMNITQAMEKLNKTRTYKTDVLSAYEFRLKVFAPDRAIVCKRKEICTVWVDLLKQINILFTGKAGLVKKTGCIFEGDDSCTYEIKCPKYRSLRNLFSFDNISSGFMLCLGLLAITPLYFGLNFKLYSLCVGLVCCILYLKSVKTERYLLKLQAEIFNNYQEFDSQYDKLRKAKELEKKNEIGELALLIAHDIRSPLAAFAVLEGEITTLPEDTRVMIRSAINRIRDIANNLLEKNRAIAKGATSADKPANVPAPSETTSVHLISSLLDQVITEKRIQYRSKIGVEIEFALTASAYGHFVLIQAGEFKRVISNLINNSVEALGDTGHVKVSLTGNDGHIEIKIQDNGKGISEELLPKLMRRGETHGKVGGSGLGLYHAKNTVESWRGSLSLASTIEVGTTITIMLPKVASPDWFVPSIDLLEGSTIIVLDDDSSIHQVWQSRFNAAASGTSVEIIHFSTSREVEEWTARLAGESHPVLYLFDYELQGDKKNGLDLIETLQLQESAILVTSRYEEVGVRERCEKLGVKLIPKGMAGFVPISIQVLTNPMEVKANEAQGCRCEAGFD